MTLTPVIGRNKDGIPYFLTEEELKKEEENGMVDICGPCGTRILVPKNAESKSLKQAIFGESICPVCS